MKKTIFIWIMCAIIGCYLGGCTMVTGNRNSSFQNDKIERFSSYSKDDFTNFLKKGMSSEIEERFGEPDLQLGSGFIIVGYYLNDGTIIELNFGTGKEGLQSARILERGADIFNKKVVEDIKL